MHAPWQDLVQEFADAEDMPQADREYFRELDRGRRAGRARSWTSGSRCWATARRSLLDPIEHAILLVGLFELAAHAPRCRIAWRSTRP